MLYSSVGDSKTLAIHPWSTTHEQLDEQARRDAGVTDDLIRISVGTEHIDDIIGDFEQSFKASAADVKDGDQEQEKNNKDLGIKIDEGGAGMAGST